MKRVRADEYEDIYPTYLGIGNLQGVSGPETPDGPPAIWLPDHKSGSRTLEQPRQQMGFRRPR